MDPKYARFLLLPRGHADEPEPDLPCPGCHAQIPGHWWLCKFCGMQRWGYASAALSIDGFPDPRVASIGVDPLWGGGFDMSDDTGEVVESIPLDQVTSVARNDKTIIVSSRGGLVRRAIVEDLQEAMIIEDMIRYWELARMWRERVVYSSIPPAVYREEFQHALARVERGLPATTPNVGRRLISLLGRLMHRQRRSVPAPGDYPSDWDHLRRAVYARDGHRCTNCGASGVELHAHHVVPLSVGGTNNVSNLTTLCKRCHELLHPHMR